MRKSLKDSTLIGHQRGEAKERIGNLIDKYKQMDEETSNMKKNHFIKEGIFFLE